MSYHPCEAQRSYGVHIKPIKAQSEYMWLMQRAGKRASHHWLGVYLRIELARGASFLKQSLRVVMPNYTH